MKSYEHFSLEDFAADDDFIFWCLEAPKEMNEFWENWLKKYPEKKPLILEARRLVLDLQALEQEESEGDFEQEIWKQIEEGITPPKIEKKKFPSFLPYSIAATILLLIGAYVWNNSFDTKSTLAQNEWIDIKNDSGIIKHIDLPDNSIVKLEPFSSLSYRKNFEGAQREVYLKGEAFFDVERDTTKPFLVYANETITKVLGTSFIISAFEGEEKVEVEVKSGKVAVYAQVKSDKQTEPELLEAGNSKAVSLRPNKKLEVIPNQKVVFDREAKEMIKTISKAPKLVRKLEDMPQFIFRQEPVTTVFEALELAYGIDLIYNYQKLQTCTITTKLDDEPLLEKLEIICLSLELSFREEDGNIIIEGEACQ